MAGFLFLKSIAFCRKAEAALFMVDLVTAHKWWWKMETNKLWFNYSSSYRFIRPRFNNKLVTIKWWVVIESAKQSQISNMESTQIPMKTYLGYCDFFMRRTARHRECLILIIAVKRGTITKNNNGPITSEKLLSIVWLKVATQCVCQECPNIIYQLKRSIS